MRALRVVHMGLREEEAACRYCAVIVTHGERCG